jgi:hypothetical protein
VPAQLYDLELAERTGTPHYTLDADGRPVSHPPRQAWYSVQQAAKVWKVHPSTVLGWCRSGRLGDSAVQHAGPNGVWRIRGDVVEGSRPGRGAR